MGGGDLEILRDDRRSMEPLVDVQPLGGDRRILQGSPATKLGSADRCCNKKLVISLAWLKC